MASFQIWGLEPRRELLIFHIFAILSWPFQIASGICGSLHHTQSPDFIATITIFFLLHWAAWLQTTIPMAQRLVRIRRSDDTADHDVLLGLGIRLNQLMIVCRALVLDPLVSRADCALADSDYRTCYLHSSVLEGKHSRRSALLAHLLAAVRDQYWLHVAKRVPRHQAWVEQSSIGGLEDAWIVGSRDAGVVERRC